MAGGIDWFRWHHGSVSDPKFQLVAKKAGASVAEVIAVWACVLEAASQSEERGQPGALDFESIDCALGLDDGKAREIHARMQERSLVSEDGSVTAWSKRQPKREDDTAAERKRRQRERDKQDGTQSPDASRDVTQGHDRGEESREEDSVPKGTGASAPADPPESDPDPIFGDGLAYLVRCGVPEKGARSFLGKMRKELKDDLVAVELLVRAQQDEVSEPVPWLRAAAKKRISSGRTTAGVAL